MNILKIMKKNMDKILILMNYIKIWIIDQIFKMNKKKILLFIIIKLKILSINLKKLKIYLKMKEKVMKILKIMKIIKII